MAAIDDAIRYLRQLFEDEAEASDKLKTRAREMSQALGCCLGVAIAESRYKPEFNPNVAMEWGWMRAMGRPVIFLVDEGSFKARADVEAFTRQPFDWDDPTNTIPGAIAEGIKALRAAGNL